MKSLSLLSPLVLALLLGACKSPDKATAEIEAADVPCICGSPEEAFDGCLHPACALGKGNPDNPDCVCSPIDVGEGDDQ